MSIASFHKPRPEQQFVPQRSDVATFGHELEVPWTVLHIAIQHGASDAVLLDHDALVDAAFRVPQHERFARRSAEKVASREQIDARDLELRRDERAGVASDAELREMRGAYVRLLEQRRDKAVGAIAVLHAFADRVDARIEGLHRVVHEHAPIAAQTRRFREIDVWANAGGHD